MGLFDKFKKNVNEEVEITLEKKNDIPKILILDNNKENEKIYLDSYNWFLNNKDSILDNLKKTYIEYEELNNDFIIFSIEAMDKQELITEEKTDDNQILYISSPLSDFVDNYDENAKFLKIQCGAISSDDAFSFAFINCDTKDIDYFFHRF